MQKKKERPSLTRYSGNQFNLLANEPLQTTLKMPIDMDNI